MKKEKGITLIALVVTIVVLLILAGITISALLGKNGIIGKARDVQIITENKSVKENLDVKIAEYDILRETGTVSGSTLDWLKTKQYINEDGKVDVKKAVGQDLKYGNGTSTTDVYLIEENKLVYYDETGSKKEVGILNIRDIVVTNPNIFKFNEETGMIYGLKEINNNYYDGNTGKTDSTYSIAPYHKLVIPSEINGVKVLGIEERAFGRFTDLKEVTFQDGLTLIGNYAFEDCYELEKINFPTTLQSVRDAFSGTKWMKNRMSEMQIEGNNIYGTIILNNFLWICSTKEESITIPENVNIIGPSAFYRQQTIVNLTIPENVKIIEEGAFIGCTNLTNVMIEEGLTSIGGSAFGDTKLTSILLPNSVTSIKSGFGDYYSTFGEAKSITFRAGNNPIPEGAPWGASADCVITKLEK